MHEQEIFRDIEDVCVALIIAEAWHARAANECRGIGIRGWAKWHQNESLLHKACLDKLTKTLQDKLEFVPRIDVPELQKINQFEMNNLDDFIEHHFEWIEREKRFNKMLISPLKESKKINRELHEQLEKLEAEAQHQIALVKRVFKNLKTADFMGHHIIVVSKWMEDYFDYEYCFGDKINFNIG